MGIAIPNCTDIALVNLYLYKTQTRTVMKKFHLLALLALVLLSCSCNRYITTYEAANGKAKCGRLIK